MSPAAQKEIIYRIDAGGVIDWVSDNWNEFYRKNVPEGTIIPDFVGTSLWNHICDATTIHIYDALIAQARLTGREIVVGFRCDAPGWRRQMQMHVRAVAAGHVEFRSVTLSEERRPWVNLLDSGVRYSSQLLRVCGWCKKVLLSEQWCEMENAVQKLQIFDSNLLPKITHTICPNCAVEVRRQIDSQSRGE